jgi:hypothetical protein
LDSKFGNKVFLILWLIIKAKKYVDFRE